MVHPCGPSPFLGGTDCSQWPVDPPRTFLPGTLTIENTLLCNFCFFPLKIYWEFFHVGLSAM